MVHEKVLAFQNAIFLSNFLIKKNATNHIICGISSLLFDRPFDSMSIAQVALSFIFKSNLFCNQQWNCSISKNSGRYTTQKELMNFTMTKCT